MQIFTQLLLCLTLLLCVENPSTTNDEKLPISAEVKQMLLTEHVVQRFNVNPSLAKKVVEVVVEHEGAFTAQEILAIISIESRFRPNATSKLAVDPAKGLMQVRPNVWKLKKTDLASIDDQVKHGVSILEHYFEKLGHKDAAVAAYNVGITAFLQGRINHRYLLKYKKELKHFEAVAV